MTRTSANRARARRRIARHYVRAKGAAPAAANASFPCGAHVAHASSPEVRGAELGIIALTDAAALFVTKQKWVLLPDRIFVMTNGPAARIAQVPGAALHLPEFLCARPRLPQSLAAE
jgi:hypothetical protein